MTDFKKVTECRVCGSDRLKKYADFGLTPLANSLLDSENSWSQRYPLEVLFCEECSLSQLSVVVHPEILFSNYPYHSSVSKTFQEHCREMAVSSKKILDKNLPFRIGDGFIGKNGKVRIVRNLPNHLVIDIGANDGCLLEEFKRVGFYVIGIEPAKNLADECERKGLSVINEFWSEAVSKRVPACAVITATNVLAHVDDVSSFLSNARERLVAWKKGIMIVEVPYLYNLLRNNQFDTIYHEHLSYFLFRPLKILFSKCGMNIFKVEQHDIHGGSLRVYASPYSYEEDRSVKKLERFEEKHKLYEFKTYENYAQRVFETGLDFVNLIHNLRREGKMVIGYGASAKGVNLLNYCGLNSKDISLIVDDTPQKQGKFTPGSRIPILGPRWFQIAKPDYIALLAWNFSKEMIRRTKGYNLNGVKYIVPIPKAMVLN